ncbi:hypothetical protein FB45DRAFT_986221 [Roridomyces roridus]|uniref:FAD/NAD(P)-binding domain-containing protein n=1 Tax=Roridomyces roridus TaxID=1738132 RepID=A0AAD7CHX5_9AGAR|nr:hypothetical protein FB45DRAFT_986221 [Roridomyces roridus]
MKIYSLPTLDKLNATVPADLDAKKIAADWMASFVSCAESGNVAEFADLFIDESHWRDMLALTWDFRTFNGLADIRQFLTDRLAASHLTNFRIRDEMTMLLRPYPDIAWINLVFDFETKTGLALGIARLVPHPSGWKAHCVYTNLEELKGFPEKVGALRKNAASHTTYAEERREALSFMDTSPTVLVIGGGHSGLGVAARLKYLDVSTLVVEKHARVGDNWRTRYDGLCLHDPVWYDHLPYMPFPATWPVYAPALKLANWLESYAEALDLDVWTSSTVKSARPNSAGGWDVVVDRAGKERVFQVKHVVFATGVGFPEDRFKGQILHSTQYKRPADHAGKKMVVIGAGVSGHDVAAECYNHGIDVTMYQRSSTYVVTKASLEGLMKQAYWEGGPPADLLDRMAASFPNLMNIPLNQRLAAKIQEDQRELLDGLNKRGFKTNNGTLETGFALLALERLGGYYVDVGASQLIVDGKIKVKNGSQLAEFDETGIKLEDGTSLDADVVVFATGLGDARNGVRKLCGDAIGDQCSKIWGLNEQGELHGAWRGLGVPGLWYMLGNLQMSRFHSKHVALQIKAMEEGVFEGRYGGAQLQ